MGHHPPNIRMQVQLAVVVAVGLRVLQMPPTVLASTWLAGQILIRTEHEGGTTGIAAPATSAHHDMEAGRLKGPNPDISLTLSVLIPCQSDMPERLESQAIKRLKQLIGPQCQITQCGQGTESPGAEQGRVTTINRRATLKFGQGNETRWPRPRQQLELARILLVRPGAAAHPGIKVQFSITPGTHSLHGLDQAAQENDQLLE
ncbi:hypothetical protein D9M68_750800 [compost metagenome]